MTRLADIDIAFKDGAWIAQRGGRVIASSERKAELVRRVASESELERGTCVRLHGRDGEIQEERRYPRRRPLRSAESRWSRARS